jgi:hypothetical protein
MSLATRQWLVDHPHTVFLRDSQRDDLLDPTVTQTELIAVLEHLVRNNWNLLFTAIVSDHHDDTAACKTGPPYCGTHAHGWSVDIWPLKFPHATAFLAANDPHFQKFLSQCAELPYLLQIGLGGGADSPINQAAAGPTWFADSNADHVHIGCTNKVTNPSTLPISSQIDDSSIDDEPTF